MDEELAQLYAELEEVQNSQLDFLPRYGYSSKAEIIELIEEDIKTIEANVSNNKFDYTEEELETERMQLCFSLGIPRYF